MNIHVEVTETINARPEKIYSILADYNIGHPSILPKPYFTYLTVEKGGVGTGTVLRVGMEVFGVKKDYHLTVTEPQPGRVLKEADDEQGVVTHFTVEPVGNGEQSRVTIATDSRSAAGFKGFMERLVNPPVSRRIYKKELGNLARAAGQK
jgi:hypothetical protein